jgi:hypothetical protein
MGNTIGNNGYQATVKPVTTRGNKDMEQALTLPSSLYRKKKEEEVRNPPQKGILLSWVAFFLHTMDFFDRVNPITLLQRQLHQNMSVE